MGLDTNKLRQEFPILRSGELVYLDSAATAQKPEMVLSAMNRFYETQNANVHRGMHALAEAATVAYEEARKTIASFIGAAPQEIVFTKNCTEAINLVARCISPTSVALSLFEHHSNIVPWQQTGAAIEWFENDNDINKNVQLIAITGLSNVLGTKPNVGNIIQHARDIGALVLVDAAQLIVHEKIDVRALDCDFLCFSGHKLYGPTGIGVLYAKQELLEQMPPFLGGGSMIGEVTTAGFTCADIPQKFEAGTPPIAEAVGLHAAIDWLSQFDWSDIQEHETKLMGYATQQLQTIDGLTILGTPVQGCVSFTVNGVHPHDLTEILGRKHIALRAGHHCTQPLHDHLGIKASTRMSFGIYNTTEDIDRCITAMNEAISLLKK